MEKIKLAGGRVSFDPNIRPDLWQDLELLHACLDRALRMANVVKLSEEELVFISGSDDLAQGIASSSLANECRDRRDAAKLRRELRFLCPYLAEEHIVVERRELRCKIAQCLASCCLFFHDDSFFLVYPCRQMRHT